MQRPIVLVLDGLVLPPPLRELGIQLLTFGRPQEPQLLRTLALACVAEEAAEARGPAGGVRLADLLQLAHACRGDVRQALLTAQLRFAGGMGTGTAAAAADSSIGSGAEGGGGGDGAAAACGAGVLDSSGCVSGLEAAHVQLGAAMAAATASPVAAEGDSAGADAGLQQQTGSSGAAVGHFLALTQRVPLASLRPFLELPWLASAAGAGTSPGADAEAPTLLAVSPAGPAPCAGMPGGDPGVAGVSEVGAGASGGGLQAGDDAVQGQQAASARHQQWLLYQQECEAAEQLQLGVR